MLIKHNILIVCALATTFMATMVATNSLKRSPSKEARPLEFSFNVLVEKKLDALGGTMWMATIILPKASFSRENLERLFRWYSERHPDRNERLTVQVYTDPKKIQQTKMDTPIYPQTLDKQSTAPGVGWADAAFFRSRPSAASHGAGENEFFIYDPTMSGNTSQRRIVVKGMDPYAVKRTLEAWEPQRKEGNLRISAYELNTAEPSRVYYALESHEPDSNYWESIITFQREGEVRIPSDQIRFVSNKLVYIFMGPFFAVTFDGGSEWAAWDADRDIPCEEHWTSAMIRDVQIDEQTGIGTMNVALVDKSKTLELRTIDFGAHWSCK